MKINEIFYSLQGEGHHSGTPAIFIRLSGCNLKCPFCDTVHNDGIDMSDHEIYLEIAKYPARMVILTGGEPSLFITDDFVQGLKSRGYYIAIETNGTHRLPKSIDWITVSPKDTFVTDNSAAQIVLSSCDELKVIFTGETPKSYPHIKAHHRYLQPCDTGDVKTNSELLTQCIDYIKCNPEWNLSLQTHKILGIR